MGDKERAARALATWQSAVDAYRARAAAVTADEHPFIADELEALDWEQHRTLEAFLTGLRDGAPPRRRASGRHRRGSPS